MVAKHSGLANWNEQKFTWADLMFQESEAVMGTMLALMDKGSPSYAVHDSLIVRAKDEALSGIIPHLPDSAIFWGAKSAIHL